MISRYQIEPSPYGPRFRDTAMDADMMPADVLAVLNSTSDLLVENERLKNNDADLASLRAQLAAAELARDTAMAASGLAHGRLEAWSRFCVRDLGVGLFKDGDVGLRVALQDRLDEIRIDAREGDQAIGGLLAAVHGDGKEHMRESFVRACADAERIVNNLRKEVEKLGDENQALVHGQCPLDKVVGDDRGHLVCGLDVDGGTAALSPFGTIRVCLDCGCLVAGGPTRCGRCAHHPSE